MKLEAIVCSSWFCWGIHIYVKSNCRALSSKDKPVVQNLLFYFTFLCYLLPLTFWPFVLCNLGTTIVCWFVMDNPFWELIFARICFFGCWQIIKFLLYLRLIYHSVAFKALGKLIHDVGLMVAYHCDQYGKFLLNSDISFYKCVINILLLHFVWTLLCPTFESHRLIFCS